MKMTKHLDQHFLTDKTVLQKIIAAADITPDDVILEIGAGTGVLTEALAHHAKKVITIEIDTNMRPYLEKLPSSVHVIYGNALTLIDTFSFTKIVSNIPYSITEPLFKKITHHSFARVVLLTGKQFYQLLSDTKSKWSTIGKLFFTVKKIADVSREAFTPKPRTDSVLFVLEKRTIFLSKDEELIKTFILQTDKKVKNALVSSLHKMYSLTQNQAKNAVDTFTLSPTLLEKSVDTLSNTQFYTIIQALHTFSEKR